MSDLPICPPGYNSDPVVLSHISRGNAGHPDNDKLRIALCTPAWFCPIDYITTRNVIRCPACYMIINEDLANEPL